MRYALILLNFLRLTCPALSFSHLSGYKLFKDLNTFKYALATTTDGSITAIESGPQIPQCLDDTALRNNSYGINKDDVRISSGATVWTTFGELAAKTDSVNLGQVNIFISGNIRIFTRFIIQGFPDWNPPGFVLNSLKEIVHTTNHQYTRPAGHPELVEYLAYRYQKHLNRIVDPYNEIAITVGASQALFLALTCFLKSGDEVIVFDPYFELYTKQIKLTGATPKFVSLGGDAATESDPWALDIAGLER